MSLQGTLILLLGCIISLSLADPIPEDPKLRVDCTSDVFNHNDKYKVCQQRTCFYDESVEDLSRDIPPCSFYRDSATYDKYVAKTVKNDNSGVKIELIKNRENPGEPDTINIDVTPLENEQVRIKIYDPKNQRWETPLPEITPVVSSNFSSQITVTVDNGILTITRKVNNIVLFKSNLKQMFFRLDYMQLAVNVPNSAFYGLGENLAPFLKNVTDTKLHYAFLNYGNPPEHNNPMYGSHPFYMMFDQRNDMMHGFYVHSSNMMDITFRSSKLMTIRSLGGVFDFFLFLGPTPNDILKQKGELIPKAPMPPMWSLGFQVSKYGYNHLSVVKDLTTRMTAAKIPYDVQWFDIDYMRDFNMFTYDKTNFDQLPEFIDETHKNKRKVVFIIEPSLSDVEPAGYEPYEKAKAMDLFIKNEDGKPARGRVWTSKSCVFLDYTKNETGDFWTDELTKFHTDISFDGLWTDMNEPANFEDEQGQAWNENSCPKNDLNFPSYNAFRPTTWVFEMSMCMSHKHSVGTHAEVHNIYSFYQTRQTYNALKSIKPDERPFVLSRASHIGQGRYSNHWLGDVFSTWEFLENSIPQIMNFNLFGIPLAGSDICGFLWDTNEALCSRWSSAGAFYPFSRNHNDINRKDQDPPAMGPAVTMSAKVSLDYRYRLLPYLYTLFYQHTLDGRPVVSSLMQNFYYDYNTLAIEDQFLWGMHFMVIPITQPEIEYKNAYFPQGVWFVHMGLNKEKRGVERIIKSEGMWQGILCPFDDICVAHRGGSIIPIHIDSVMNTEDINATSRFGIEVYQGLGNDAIGEFYFDDKSDKADAEKVYVEMVFKNNTVSLTPQYGSNYTINLHEVRVHHHTDVKADHVYVDQVEIPTSDFSIDKGVLQIELKTPLNLIKDHQIYWE